MTNQMKTSVILAIAAFALNKSYLQAARKIASGENLKILMYRLFQYVDYHAQYKHAFQIFNSYKIRKTIYFTSKLNSPN